MVYASQKRKLAVAATYPNALIIGSDQVATVDGKIYLKPGNHERAAEQLRGELSGKPVNFLQVCVYLRNNWLLRSVAFLL